MSYEKKLMEHADDGTDMARQNLRHIEQYAHEIHDMVAGAGDLPDWMEHKISQAAGAMSSIKHKLQGMQEEAVGHAQLPHGHKLPVTMHKLTPADMGLFHKLVRLAYNNPGPVQESLMPLLKKYQ